MADEHEEWVVYNFSQANPAGDNQGDVAALLRRVAATVEELGPIEVQDIVFHPETGFGEVADDPMDARVSMTVYYQRPDGQG